MFHLSGHVNFQNNSFPTLIHKMSLRDRKVGVRFAVTATGITGSMCPQTINSHWGNTHWYYILNTYDYNGTNALFQQGSVTAYTPNNSIRCLKRTFGDNNKQGIVDSSFTMNLCCFYLWGILKGNTSCNNPRTEDTQRTTSLLGDTSVCKHLLDSKKPNHNTLNENVPAHSLNVVSKKFILTVIHCVGPTDCKLDKIVTLYSWKKYVNPVTNSVVPYRKSTLAI
jgi:hypothetical protein